MKRICLIFIIIFLAVCFLFEGCGKMSDEDYVSKIISIALPRNITVVSNDTHGGPLGDGTYFAKINFPDNEINSFTESVMANKWERMPLRDDINIIMYGGKRGDVEYALLLAKEVGMPKVENGYWLFVDRNSEESEGFLERNSYNFNLAIFDTDTDTLYVYQLDT